MSFVGNIFKQRVSEMRNSTFLFFPLPLERITKRREHSSKHGVLQERDFRLMCNIVWCGKGLVNLTGETLSLVLGVQRNYLGSAIDSTQQRQENQNWVDYWSELPFLSSRDLRDIGIKLGSPALQADSLPFEQSGKTIYIVYTHDLCTKRHFYSITMNCIYIYIKIVYTNCIQYIL